MADKTDTKTPDAPAAPAYVSRPITAIPKVNKPVGNSLDLGNLLLRPLEVTDVDEIAHQIRLTGTSLPPLLSARRSA